MRSLTNKLDDLQQYLEELVHKFSVIGISETWLQSINQSRLLSYMRHGCPVAQARGSCLKRKTIKLAMSKAI